MTLSADDSKLFLSCKDTNATASWMKTNTTDFSNSRYSYFVQLSIDWATAYGNNDLYLTINGSQQQVTGIDQTPVIHPR